MEQKKSRREKGSGSVFQKPDGSWIGRISIGKRADGKPKMKYFSGRTEAEVKKKIRDFIKTNDGADYKKVSLEEYLNNWLSVYKRAELKNTSYDRLESTARNYVIPNFGYLQMADITADDIQPFFTNARNSGLSYSSVKKIYDCLNSMFNFCNWQSWLCVSSGNSFLNDHFHEFIQRSSCGNRRTIGNTKSGNTVYCDRLLSTRS